MEEIPGVNLISLQKSIGMKKQTVIITGVSSNIGSAIALYFLRNGDNVVINATSNEKLKEIFYELGAGGNLAMAAGDVSNRVTALKVLAVAIANFGSADVLINNFGIFEFKSFLNLDEIYLDNLLNKSLKGIIRTTQGIIPQMIKQGCGIVINVGSPVYGHAAGDFNGTSLLVLNGAISSLTIQLMEEFGKHNIRFNTITPGSSHLHDISTLGRGLKLKEHIDRVEHLVTMVYSVAKSEFITGAIITT